MSKNTPKPPAHPGAAVLAIGGMSLVLAVALQVLGLSRRLDEVIAVWMKGTGLEGGFSKLPAQVPWLWTVPMVFALAAGMLGSRLNWRRMVLWVTTLVLTVAWAPVLALTGHQAPLTMPLFALLWCGLWAMIYATRHQEPGERAE